MWVGVWKFIWEQIIVWSISCSIAYCYHILRAIRGSRSQSPYLTRPDHRDSGVHTKLPIKLRQVYHKVWYELHVCPDSRWQDVLVICRLWFSLPFSNGCVDRIFPSLKLIKTNRRTRLNHATLNDLIEIHVEGPTLRNFTPKHAVEAWWSSCKTSHRSNWSSRKEYTPQDKGASTSTVDTEKEDEQSIWSHWMGFLVQSWWLPSSLSRDSMSSW